MKWRTEIQPLAMQGLIGRDTKIATIGSCFSDTIGQRLAAHGFDVAVNPAGIMFNPLSIAAEIHATAHLSAADASRFVRRQMTAGEMYVSLDRHSAFASPTAEGLGELIANSRAAFRTFLAAAGVVAVTLGSARGFIHNATGRVVANCHKIHPREFTAADFTLGEIAAALRGIVSDIRGLNPRAKIIFTVSPVRHAAYGLAADRLSKSLLIVAAHQIAGENQQAIYFPAYEALTDDLRDYRFYAPDLVHPSELAADYIFYLFARSFMEERILRQLPSLKK